MSERSALNDWLTADVWKIAGSAFFADLGYQAVLALFPLYLVLVLKAPVWVYGLAMGLAYGPGAFIAWWGGRLGDRRGHRPVALTGNALIPLLSFVGIATAPSVAVGLLTVGWWARNFRTPSRRVLLVHRVVDDRARRRAFGFLHALDVGGGVLAGLGVVGLLALGWPMPRIFLVTVVPLLLSTLALAMLGPEPQAPSQEAPPAPEVRERQQRQFRGILWASALYGFSAYNLGFPILTVAQHAKNSALGVLAYVIFLAVSSATGWGFGRVARATVGELSGLGYGAAALGSLGLALATIFSAPVWVFWLAVAVLGFALGVVETLEPTLTARWTSSQTAGGGMGALTATRSIGLFAANLVMGLLYRLLTPGAAYGYAAVVALAAAVVLWASARPDRPLAEAVHSR